MIMIERYNLGWENLYESEDGEWVQYEDYKTELDDCAGELRKCKRKCDLLQSYVDYWRDEYHRIKNQLCVSVFSEENENEV